MLFQEFLLFPWSASLFILHSLQPAAARPYCSAAESIVRREPGYTHRLRPSLQSPPPFLKDQPPCFRGSRGNDASLRPPDPLKVYCSVPPLSSPCTLLPSIRLISRFSHIGGPTRGHSSTNTMEAGGAARGVVPCSDVVLHEQRTQAS